MLDTTNENYIEEISNEVPDDLAKELTGRSVIFGEGQDMAWGIEADIPVKAELLELLEKYGLHIPGRIKNIKFLTLSPQESILPSERNIRVSTTVPSTLLRITDMIHDHKTFTPLEGRPYEYIAREFMKVVSSDDDKLRFTKVLEDFQGEEILIVQGHGGGDPMSIGEQHDDVIPKDKNGNNLQRKGNDVLVKDILEHYDHHQKLSVILLESCYTGNKMVIALKKPVIYVSGASSLNNSLKGVSRSVFSIPNKQ